ncbi:hypothetical protein EDC04DRAFT_2922060, partial [Pisolithus marmoratus]
MNQFMCPAVPLDQIKPLIRQLWKACLTDQEIVAKIRKHIDMSMYGIGLRKFQQICKQLGLLQTCQQGHTCKSICEVMVEKWIMYPDAGVHEMIRLLFHEEGMSVSRSVMWDYCHTYEPHLLKQCKVNRLQHCHFWVASVNDIWAVDQHDKWLHFGLVLHTGIKPFLGWILWIKVWHSNCNLQLILSYYLATVKEFGYVPMIIQSNPGTENFGIANAQMLLWQMHDSTLEGYVQHWWMHSKKNIMPEIAWSQLRRHFPLGLSHYLIQAWMLDGMTLTICYSYKYSIPLHPHTGSDPVHSMVFHWVFIPWLQVELNNYQDCINNSQKHCNKHKVGPSLG